MKKYKFDPANYDFIWKVNNFDYFFFSFWLYKEYKERDMLFTNIKTKNGGEWETYMSKDARKKTSEMGYRFLKSPIKFKTYENKVCNHIKEAKKYFSYLKNKNYFRLTNQELVKELIKAVHFSNNLWRPYFVTEYFCYDKVDRILRNGNGNKKLLALLMANVRRMQKIKFNLRNQLNQTVFGNHIFLKMLKESSKRTGITLPKLYKLGYLEIAKLLTGKRIKLKYKENYIVGEFSDWKLILDNRALQLTKKLKNYLKSHAGDVLRGQTGNKGHYIGKVKIIPFDLNANLAKIIGKMKKGNILVTGSTGPEMILACKKAGAIVTEEGGITSHAAIVSRELGIPAVIGTKIATEVLKDGDLVEVDAEKGVVRIIKRT